MGWLGRVKNGKGMMHGEQKEWGQKRGQRKERQGKRINGCGQKEKVNDGYNI